MIETGKGEEECGNALGHNGKRHPGADFVGVVGAGDEADLGIKCIFIKNSKEQLEER